MRAGDTYRAARRNAVLRGTFRQPWSPRDHYGASPKVDRRTVLSRKPSRYHPLPEIGQYLKSIGRRWVGRPSQVA